MTLELNNQQISALKELIWDEIDRLGGINQLSDELEGILQDLRSNNKEQLVMRQWVIPMLTFILANKVYPLANSIRAPYDNINVTNNNYTMNIEITSYTNPYYPTRVYFKATYGNESYHHIDKAIVQQWLYKQIMDQPFNEQKQRLTEKAIDAFYKK